MITDTGKQLIGKYLVGQIDSYASYLAIGSGPKPLLASDSFGDYSTKTSLDFETLRVPIIARSLSTENGVTKITLTAELPTEERYEITEIGLYPSLNNPIPTGLDSQQILLFNEDEIWKTHIGSSGAESEVPLQFGVIFNSNNNINISDKAFFTNSNNALFENINYPDRIARHERPRFLDRTIFLRGNQSVLTVNGEDLTVTSGDHIRLSTSPIIFDKNSTNDELRLAFTVINRNGIGSSDVPNNVKILIQFATTGDSSAEYASFVVNLNKYAEIKTQTPTGTTNISITTADSHGISVGDSVTVYGVSPGGYNGTWTAQAGTTETTLVLNIGSNPGIITTSGKAKIIRHIDFENNRYVVVSKPIKDLYKTTNFAWDSVSYVKIFVCVTNGGSASGDFYVALDALKLENVSSFSEVYGLTAYTVMKTSDALPIVKSDNSSSFIEFSYAVDV